MEQILVQNAQAYAAQHQLRLAERLGFGIHGIILVAEDKVKVGTTAVKAHRSLDRDANPASRSPGTPGPLFLNFLLASGGTCVL